MTFSVSGCGTTYKQDGYYVDGTYERIQPVNDEAAMNSQEWFLNHWKLRTLRGSVKTPNTVCELDLSS